MSDFKPDIFIEVDVGSDEKPNISVEVQAGGGSALPTGGEPGQVLTKTEDGAAWRDPAEVAAAVTSVNGKTGDVEITPENIGALSEDALPEAVNAALAQAKESGEFDGEPGQRGTGILPVDHAPRAYTEEAEIDGKKPLCYFEITNIKNDAGVDEVLVGDVVEVGDHHFCIYYVDDTYAYIDKQTAIKGKDGSPGKDGTSVTITNVQESNEDGGSNIVTFSDGNTLTVKNGKTGSGGGSAADALMGNVSEVTPEQVAIAVMQGRNVLVGYQHNVYGFLVFADFMLASDMELVASTYTFEVGSDVANCQLAGNIANGAWEFTLEPLAKYSDLPDTSAFITNTVSDLHNYYLKSQTYTQEEINQRISAIPKFAIQVVDSLPTENISGTTVYLVRDGEETNLYTEYIYVSGAWEILGSQRVDLTGYATQTWTLEQLAGYQPKGDYLTEVPEEQIESVIEKYLAENPVESGGGLTITDDGDGNVVINSTGNVTITDDGSGNVVIE